MGSDACRAGQGLPLIKLFQPLRTRFQAWLHSPPRRAARAAAGTTPTACVTVVIPALNEAARIASVVRYALADPATAEVIVVDDSSIDDTVALARAAGARVFTSTLLGKGTSMADGTAAAQQDLLVFLDGDLAGLRPGIVSDMVRPLLADEADFVKARFGRGGGRVTELTAKPMLKVFFPELAQFAQPLGGIVAGRRSLLRELGFEEGYGVDVGLLIDAHRAGARLAEVDIGSLEHDSQPLVDLAAMANEVSRVIYERARAVGRLRVEQIRAMHETQRLATADIEYVLTRRRGRSRLALLDMDGTLTTGRFALELAHATGREEALAGLLDGGQAQGAALEGAQGDAATRSHHIAALFRFVPRREFERIAHASVLRPGAIEFVNRLKRAGFMVGVVSDSYFVAAEVVRRRVFADFALAHLIQFDNGACTGELRLNPAFTPPDGGEGAMLCKSQVVRRFRADTVRPRVREVWAVGDNLNDAGMLQAADRGFAISPKSPRLAQLPGVQVVQGFDELLAELDSTGPRATMTT